MQENNLANGAVVMDGAAGVQEDISLFTRYATPHADHSQGWCRVREQGPGLEIDSACWIGRAEGNCFAYSLPVCRAQPSSPKN
jgi:hypothetical protein